MNTTQIVNEVQVNVAETAKAVIPVVSGKQEFMGHEIPVVEGGFGEGQKCISDKTVAEIHGMKMYHVRELITRNSKRFQKNTDIIDLKEGIVQNDTFEKVYVGQNHTLELLQNLGYAKQSITQAAHIYLLSERGYAKLIKIMGKDLAWEIHDKVIESYFHQTTSKISVPEANCTSVNPQIALYDENYGIQIKLVNEQFVVSSREVAERFEKQNKHINETIKKFMVENSTVKTMFEEVEYKSIRGRMEKEYLMNRDGFSLLAMGFTGKKALEWKLKYIKAFNAMEAAWNSPERILARALQLSNTENKQLKQEKALLIEQIQENTPKIEEWERFMDSDGTISMNDTAKLLHTGRNQLMKFLRKKRILLKDRSAATQYVKRGYFHVSIECGVGLYGKEYHNPITRTTAKGMSFLYRYLKKHYDEYLEYDENFVVDDSMVVM